MDQCSLDELNLIKRPGLKENEHKHNISNQQSDKKEEALFIDIQK